MTTVSSRRRFLRNASIGAVALYTLSGPAVAHQVDGSQVTEIDGCTSITEPGQYALVTDIVHDQKPHTCITIEASDVTLDGRGHALIATWFDGGVGDGVSIHGRNVEVKNLNVIGMEHAFFVHGPEARFDNVTVSGTDVGFLIRGADQTIIANSVISGNTAGIDVHESDGHTFENNAVVSNGPRPIHFTAGCSQWTVQDSTISHNRGAGIQVSGEGGDGGGVGNLIRDNVVAFNRGRHGFGPGIAINRFTPARARNLFIARNTLVGNSQDGLFLRHVDDSRVARNVIVRNGDHGIRLTDSDDNIVKRNVLLENGSRALTVDSGSTENRVWGNFSGW